jgi:N-acyl-D-amino-acid deacylase
MEIAPATRRTYLEPEMRMPRPRRVPLLSALAALALLGATAGGAHAQETYDVLIRGGRVLDGSGNPWFAADVGIRGDRIAAIGDLRSARATTVIDARGLYVTPGFIDTHSHSSGGLTTAATRSAQALLAQGLTTVFVNPDGGGPVDVAAQRQQLERGGVGVNVAQMVPHGSVRSQVVGSANRAATPQELTRMEELVRAGMRAGAFGLSSGTFYVPGSYAPNSELVALGKVAGEFGGAYQSHIRDESDYGIGLLASVEEVISVARDAGIPGVVTHVKALGPNVWGFGSAVVSRIERAREEGVQVYADQYPYTASSTGLSAALLPRWAQADGSDSVRARMANPETRARIRAELVDNLKRRAGPEAIQFSRFAGEPSNEGKTLAQVAREHGRDPVDEAMRMLEGGGGPSIVSFNMNEDDIATLMVQPWTMTASDGDLPQMGQGVPHPRAYGTFTRKLERYVEDLRVVDLPFAVRSMTSLPAQVYHVQDRGTLRVGSFADVAVFDLSRVHEIATYTDPHHLSEGMVHVFVNGQQAVKDGRFTNAMAGRVLRR